MSVAIPLPFRQGTPAWVEARRDSIGSSDIPVLTGSSPFRGTSPLDLWAYKTRRLEAIPVDEMTQELYDLGHALEPVIGERYTAMTGRKLRRVSRMLRHPEVPWATASLDRVSAVRGERLIVELKWDPWARFGQSAEEVPPHVQDQVQWQLLVSGYEAAEVAVLMGSHVERLEVAPDRDYQEGLLVIAGDFWMNHVQAGVPPEIDGSEATRRALARLHPTDDGTFMEPTAELHALMAQLREAIPAEKAATEEVARLKNAIRSALGDHSGAEADGWRITFKRGKGRRSTDWHAVAQVMHSLTGLPPEHLDEEAEKHTTTGEASRPLLTRWTGTREQEEGHWT